MDSNEVEEVDMSAELEKDNVEYERKNKANIKITIIPELSVNHFKKLRKIGFRCPICDNSRIITHYRKLSDEYVCNLDKTHIYQLSKEQTLKLETLSFNIETALLEKRNFINLLMLKK